MKPGQSMKIVVLLGAAGGCSLGSKMTEDEFCQDYSKRECAKVANYCSFSASSCEPSRLDNCKAMAAASKTGARQFNVDNADRCLKQLDTTYASLPIDATKLAALDAACARVFSGSAKANESCTVDFDCTGDLICDKARCGTRKVVAAGGGCANIGETCPTGQYCNMANATSPYFCTSKQGQGAACSDAQPCTEKLRCTGTCGPRLAIGMICTSDDECESLYCNPYAPAGARKCGVGLSFSDGSPSCLAFMGSPPP
jgi:hypothetical protein